MNVRLAPSDLAHVAGHAGADLLFVDESLIPLAESIAPDFKPSKGYVILTDKKSGGDSNEFKPGVQL
jgi:fatty-acyl-CoA synthase